MKIGPFSIGPRRGPIGLDIGGRRIAAAQVGGAGVIDAAAKVARSQPDAPFTREEASRLAGVLERHGFSGSNVVLAAPTASLVTAALELPPRSSNAPIAHLARLELARSHRLDPESFEMAAWDIPAPGRGGDATHMIAAALPHAKAEEFVGVFDGTSLNVVAIDLRSLAICRAVGGAARPHGLCGVVELAWECATVTVQKSRVVLYERTIAEYSLRTLFGAVQKRMGLTLDAAEAAFAARGGAEGTRHHELMQESRGCLTEFLDGLVPEVERSISYAVHRYPADELGSVVVCGDGAGLPGLVERLAEATGAPVDALALKDCGRTGAAVSGFAADGALLVAAGLAMHGAQGGELPAGRAAA